MGDHVFTLPSPENLACDEELRRLQHVTLQINEAISTLSKQRAAASKQVNVFQSATRSLPSETLSLVFAHACVLSKLESPSSICQGPDPNHFLFTLAGVSSLWRQTVYSNPQLWTNVCIRFNGRPAKGAICLLHRYLTHSGAMKLDLDFSFHTFTGDSLLPSPCHDSVAWPGTDVLVHPSIDSVIVENLHRVQSLYLRAGSTKWLSHTSKLSSIIRFTFVPSCLTTHGTDDYLSVRPDAQNLQGDSGFTSFPNSPHLRELSLGGDTFINIHSGLDRSKITIIHLCYMKRSACIDLLAACPNVEEYRASSTKYSPWPTPVTPLAPGGPVEGASWSSAVTRQSLKVFEWDMGRDPHPQELCMLYRLHLPVLEKLILRVWSIGQQPFLRAFCSRLPLTLSSIHLSLSCFPDESFSECVINTLPATLEVEELMIGCLSCSRSADHALMSMKDPDFLPKVKKLEIFGPRPMGIMSPLEQLPLVLGPHASGLVVQAVRARILKKLISGFQFELKKIFVAWTPETRDQIRALEKEAGRNLNIIQD